MSLHGLTVRATSSRPVRPQSTTPPAPVPPLDQQGHSASAYGALARSYRERGDATRADQHTLLAVQAAKTGKEALTYAAQRYGPLAEKNNGMNQYVRSDAPYVASAGVQAQAFTLAAAKFTDLASAEWALRYHPAETKAANTIMLKRIVDLTVDGDQVRDLRPLIKMLGTPEALAYAEAAREAKPKPSFWTRLHRILQSL